MVIFNSYVKLPEGSLSKGTGYSSGDPKDLQAVQPPCPCQVKTWWFARCRCFTTGRNSWNYTRLGSRRVPIMGKTDAWWQLRFFMVPGFSKQHKQQRCIVIANIYVEIVNQKKMIDNVMIMSWCSWFEVFFHIFHVPSPLDQSGIPWWHSGPKLPWFVARNAVLCPFFNVACQK